MDLSPDNKVSFESHHPQEVQQGVETPQVGIGIYTALLKETVLAILRESPQIEGERLFRLTLERLFIVADREDGGFHITVLEGAFWFRIIQVMDLVDEATKHHNVMKKFIAARLGLNVDQDQGIINRVLEEVVVNCGGIMKIEITGQRLVAQIHFYKKIGTLLEVVKTRGEGKPSPADLKQALRKKLGDSAEINGLG